MLLTPKSFPVVQTTPANTNVPAIPAGYQYITSVVVYADSANTGDIFVGGANNSPTAGIPVAPGSSLSLAVDESHGQAVKLDLETLTIQSATTTNTARVLVLVGN